MTLLLVSLAGIFAGIGLRVQVFLWLGLVGFVLDVVYQLGRMGLEHTLAKWAHHARARAAADPLRRAQREEADRADDARLPRPGPAVGLRVGRRNRPQVTRR